MNQHFEYRGEIYIRPLDRGIILGRAGDFSAPYFEDLISNMLSNDDTIWLNGSNEYEIELKITLKNKRR